MPPHSLPDGMEFVGETVLYPRFCLDVSFIAKGFSVVLEKFSHKEESGESLDDSSSLSLLGSFERKKSSYFL